ncbi:MAG: glyoxalase superfamily protein [Devosia sp.]
MHTFLDSKSMAKALRSALAERRIEITHSDSLELVARQFGFANWNMLSARIDATQVAKPALPDGWARHSDPDDGLYRMGSDPARPGAIKIESLAAAEITGDRFSTLMQSILADDYRGTRLRLSAQLAGKDVGQSALWLRIDGQGGKVLRFDNMLRRPVDGAICGTFEWTGRSIVLDVPDDAVSLHYGAMLKGSGQLWVRAFRLDEAGLDTATTDRDAFPRRPTNLDFGGATA